MEAVSSNCDNLTGYDASVVEAGEVSFGHDVIHPDGGDPVWRPVQEAVASDDPFRLEDRVVTAEETAKWVCEQGQSVGGSDGSAVLDGFITDVPEHSYRTREADGSTQRRRRVD